MMSVGLIVSAVLFVEFFGVLSYLIVMRSDERIIVERKLQFVMFGAMTLLSVVVIVGNFAGRFPDDMTVGAAVLILQSAMCAKILMVGKSSTSGGWQE